MFLFLFGCWIKIIKMIFDVSLIEEAAMKNCP